MASISGIKSNYRLKPVKKFRLEVERGFHPQFSTGFNRWFLKAEGRRGVIYQKKGDLSV